jgi:hypothetical protein
MARVMLLSALAAGLALVNMGCAPNPMVGHNMVMSQQYFGDVGITGHGNNLTVLPGSRLHKLSLIGDNNTITLQDDVTVWKIEFWGKGNTVSVPEYLSVRTNDVGANQIIRRPYTSAPMPRTMEPAPAYNPPPAGNQTPARVEPKPQPKPAGEPLPPEADMMDSEVSPDEK